MKRFCGLSLRATGLVALVIGVTLIVNWLRIDFNGGNNSGPHRIFGTIGIGVTIFGVACRSAAYHLLKGSDPYDGHAPNHQTGDRALD